MALSLRVAFENGPLHLLGLVVEHHAAVGEVFARREDQQREIIAELARAAAGPAKCSAVG